MLASKLVALSICLACCSLSASAQTTWHVDDDAAPGGSGLSWASALHDLDAALAQAAPFDPIWLAEGFYQPSVPCQPGDSRSQTFQLGEARSIHGGFLGYEGSLDERAGSPERTVLSGDLGVSGDNSDNAYHVVRIHHPFGIPLGPVVLDGLTIEGGNAVDDLAGGTDGGGIRACNLGVVLNRVTLRSNRAERGGGLFLQPASARISWCRFIDNEATRNGGALLCQAAAVFAHGTLFAGNRAGQRGGAVYLPSNGSIWWGGFSSCVFHDNEADLGGALGLPGSNYTSGNAVLSNCTLAFNRARQMGGAVWGQDGVPQEANCLLTNSLVWFNSAPLASQLAGGRYALVSSAVADSPNPAGWATLQQPPEFVDPGSRDLRLLSGSPGIDQGSMRWILPDLLDLDHDLDLSEPAPFDADHRPRVMFQLAGQGFAPAVDLGAFELASH